MTVSSYAHGKNKFVDLVSTSQLRLLVLDLKQKCGGIEAAAHVSCLLLSRNTIPKFTEPTLHKNYLK